MNEEKTTESSPVEDESSTAKEGKKRISYVAKDLKVMIEFVGRVYSLLGHTAYHSNKAIATVNGLSPDSIKLHLSAGQQYKILELKHGVGYKITDHFQRIFLPKNDQERRTAVIESLKNPDTYHQLFKDYEFHTVPSEGVKNHFIRQFGMNNDVAAKAAQVFLNNLRDFDLLDSRGVLTSGMPSKPTIADVKQDGEQQIDDNPTNSGGNQDDTGSANGLPARQPNKVIFQSELDATNKKTIPIYLIANKQALFVYPDDITEDDIELVKHQIDGVLLRIKLEAKKKAQLNEKRD